METNALPAILNEQSTLWDTISFMLTGFLIVLGILALLFLLLQVMGRLFRRTVRPAIQKLPAAVPASAPAHSGGLSPEVIAVITAAVDSVMDSPHRIRSIEEHDASMARVNLQAWSAEGRRQIFHSHQLR